MLTTCLGFMAFAPAVFWLSLYFQNVKHLSALSITAHLLPMVVSGTLVNVVCGLILHKVSNKLLMGIGALAYTAAFLILSFMRADALYWEFIFPALCLIVVGADIEFNVANVSSHTSVSGVIFASASTFICIRLLARPGICVSDEKTSHRCTSCRLCPRLSNPLPVAFSTQSSSCA